MESEYTKVYISLPRSFLEKLDGLARSEHQSRSAVIREAVKHYMEWRGMPAEERFGALTLKLKHSATGVPEAELEADIDKAVRSARQRRRAR
jgi:metal-responsive CopG/Arc/MetJ family transcriptional regulator